MFKEFLLRLFNLQDLRPPTKQPLSRVDIVRSAFWPRGDKGAGRAALEGQRVGKQGRITVRPNGITVYWDDEVVIEAHVRSINFNYGCPDIYIETWEKPDATG